MIILSVLSHIFISELNNQTYQKFKLSPILFISGTNCQHCENAMAAIRKAQQYFDSNMYYMNCDKYENICRDNGMRTFPQLRITYKGYSFSMYGEECTEQEKINLFINQVQGDFYDSSATLNKFKQKMEEQQRDVYFVFYGKNSSEFEELALQWKTKMVTFFVEENATNRLECYKNGILIKFDGQFNINDVNRFIYTMKKPYFEKLSPQNARIMWDGFSVIYVFNPKNNTQKEIAKQIRDFATQNIQNQSQIGIKCLFHHATFESPYLQYFFQKINLTNESRNVNEKLYVLRGDKYLEYNDQVNIDDFLNEIINGTLGLEQIEKTVENTTAAKQREQVSAAEKKADEKKIENTTEQKTEEPLKVQKQEEIVIEKKPENPEKQVDNADQKAVKDEL